MQAEGKKNMERSWRKVDVIINYSLGPTALAEMHISIGIFLYFMPAPRSWKWLENALILPISHFSFAITILK